MKKLLLLGLIPLISVLAYGQINLNDSTVQVVGYWDKNEKMSYDILGEKYKVRGSDTINRESYKYTVEIRVVKSTPDSYEIEWNYGDYEMEPSQPIMKKIAAISTNMTVRIRTDELGEFKEVVNWKEIRDVMRKGFKMMRRELKKDPTAGQIIENIEKSYYTKEGIEAGVIQEIRQFYMFHGRKYVYNEEYTANSKVANLYGGEPFDACNLAYCDEIDSENDTYIVRLHQSVDAEQLAKVVKEYMNKVLNSANLTEQVIDSIPDISHDTWVASRIHGSGWVVYSIQEKEVQAEGVLNYEKRIISIKD